MSHFEAVRNHTENIFLIAATLAALTNSSNKKSFTFYLVNWMEFWWMDDWWFFILRKAKKKASKKVFASRVRVEKFVWSLAINHQFHLETFSPSFFSFLFFFLCVSLRKSREALNLRHVAKDVDVRGKISSSLKREFRLCVEEKMKKKGEKRCFVRETPSNPGGFNVLRHLLNIFHQRFSSFDLLGHWRQRKTWL